MRAIFIGLGKRLRRSTAFIVSTVIIFLFISDTKVYSLENELKFKRITIEDGLSQGTVEAIFQDSKGYMWFGTGEGLNRYDGYEFKVYKHNVKDHNSLTSNYVDAIIEDEEGFLWIGTSNGLNKLDTSTESFTNYLPDLDNPHSLSHSNVWTLLEDREGYIWIGTEKGLNKYDKANDTFTRFFYSENDANSLSNDFVTTLCEDRNGNIWVGTKNGLNKLDPKTNKFTRYMNIENDSSSLSDNSILKIFEDYYGNLWIGTEKSGLNKFDKGTGTFKRYIINKEVGDSLSIDKVRAINQDRDGNLWVGSSSGLCKFNIEKEEHTYYKNQYYNLDSLIHDNVMSIFEDKTGMLWIGTEKGISKLYPNPKFKYYKRNPVESNSLSDDMISGIYVDKEGLLWVGTYNNGLNKIDRSTGKVDIYTADFKNKTSLSNKSVWSIAEDKKNNLWLATNEGLNMLDKRTGKFTRYLHEAGNENSLIYDEIKYVYYDSRDMLWIGTRQGLDSFDVDNKVFTNYNKLLTKNNISDYFISYIFEDSKGILWLGTGLTGGLIRYDREKNTMKVYKNIPKDINSISSNSVKCIVEDEYGNLWIATNYGVNKFNPDTEAFTRYTEDEGLVNNYAYGILIDESNNPWISTNGGISKLNVSTNEFINFNVVDGLQSNEFNARSFYQNADGEMFFGGINGLNSFYPEQLSVSENKTDVVIKSFSIYEKALSFKEKIKLKYNDNYFSLQFFLTDYKNPSGNQYAYMLKGIDKEWIYASNRNYASYTNVDGGKYTFMVKGRNSNGKWSEPAAVDIEIKRAPWETSWAYIVYLLVIALVGYLIWNYVRILESLVQQRTSQLNNELEENEILFNKLIEYERIKNSYFVNLSHELRTPLNVVLSTVQLIKKLNHDNSPIEVEKLDYYMGIVKRNSNRLLTVINNLIDTSKIDSGQYKINIDKADVIFLVEETALSMKSYIEDNGLELIIDTEVEEKIIECDPVEIERCVVNLISNAVKFTPKDGNIWVTIYDKGDDIQISVKDNGIGIAEENHDKIFDRFGQIDNSIISTKAGSGIGLTLVKSLVEMHGGTIIVKSELNKGSEFIITLPAEYKAIQDHKN